MFAKNFVVVLVLFFLVRTHFKYLENVSNQNFILVNSIAIVVCFISCYDANAK